MRPVFMAAEEFLLASCTEHGIQKYFHNQGKCMKMGCGVEMFNDFESLLSRKTAMLLPQTASNDRSEVIACVFSSRQILVKSDQPSDTSLRRRTPFFFP